MAINRDPIGTVDSTKCTTAGPPEANRISNAGPAQLPQSTPPANGLTPDIRSAMADVMQFFTREEVRVKLREKVSSLSTFVYEKSDEKASNYRLAGNELFKQELYQKSIEQYTKAISSATFPSIADSSRGKELAMAFANRSAALVHLERYEEALEDIAFAEKYGYTDVGKLSKRRNQCLAKIGPTSQTSAINGHSDQSAGSICLVKINDTISGHRRGVIAKKDIKRGEIILKERPYASVLKRDLTYVHCYECFRPLPKERIFPCRGCTIVKYCSEQCSELSWRNGHQYECVYQELWDRIFDRKTTQPIALSLFVLFKNGVRKCLDSMRQPRSELSGSSDVYSLISELPFSLEEKNQSEAKSESSKARIINTDPALASAYVLTYLTEFAKLPPPPTNSKAADSSNTADVALLGGLVLKHYRQMQSAATTIKTRDLRIQSLMVHDFQTLEDRELGAALYPTLALMNHSCDPNAQLASFDGLQVVVRATRDIASGQEVFVSYGPTYRSDTYQERQRLLNERFGLECACTACVQKLESQSQSLLCPKCHGPVRPPLDDESDTSCGQCGHDGLINNEMFRNIQVNLKLSRMGSLKLISKDIDIRKAEHPLLEAHRYLSSVLYPTNHELAAIKERLAYTYGIMRKYKLMLRYANEYKRCLDEQFDREDMGYFNGLLHVIDRQRDFIDYVVKYEHVNDGEYKKEFRETIKELEANCTLALELVERHASGSNAEYYRDKLNKLMLAV